MLCLSRKWNESVVLIQDGRILGHVKVVHLEPDKVRLGFDFGREVTVHRQEVQDRIEKEASGAD